MRRVIASGIDAPGWACPFSISLNWSFKLAIATGDVIELVESGNSKVLHTERD